MIIFLLYSFSSENKTPDRLFKLFIDEIADFNNIYAKQNNVQDDLFDAVKLKQFFEILFLSGYHQLPAVKSYWSDSFLESDLDLSILRQIMSRNTFLMKWYLHLSNNNELNKEDQFVKVRPLLSILNKYYMQLFSKTSQSTGIIFWSRFM